MLKKDWYIDPLISNFLLGKITSVTDYQIKINRIIYHIPFLQNHEKFILWKCHWPDCHNCCNRQGRLPLTSDDLIQIKHKTGYKKNIDFLNNETLITNWNEQGPNNESLLMTTINLKRKHNETINDDGTYISCRFLDTNGNCTLHPSRPSVCYLYPFSTWSENKNNKIDIHATFQFTGDCPGFYISDTLIPMQKILKEYSETIYKYSMDINRTIRKNFSVFTFMP